MKRLMAMIALVFLAGCATTQPAPVPPPVDVAQEEKNKVEKRIFEASEQIQNLLVELSAAKEKQAEIADDEIQNNLDYLVSISWIGDIETVVTKLAGSVGMNCRVVGRPLAPVLVSVDLHDIPLVEAYRVIGMQAGTRADIVYQPAENAIELIYVQ